MICLSGILSPGPIQMTAPGNMRMALTFLSALTGPFRPRAIRRSSCNRLIRCEAAKPQKAKLYSTGEKLSLHQAPAKSANTPRYIVCPECAAAYIGNAITERVRVSCPSCGTVFHTSPPELYVAAPTSTDTRPPPPNSVVCPHMKVCPGCTLSRHVNNPPMLSDARTFLTQVLRLRNTPTVYMGSTHSWRTHAKLAIRRGNRGQRIVLGLFKARSHEVISIPDCAVHAPEIETAVQHVRTVLSDFNVDPYQEKTGNGLARYALFTVERSTRLVQVTLVWNVASWKDGAPGVQRIGAELWRRGRSTLHSIWFNWNTTTGNAIVNPEKERFYHMFGPQDLVENVCGVPLTFPPYVFVQANLEAFEKLLMPQLLEYVPSGAIVAEFCAGVGVIGLAVLRHRSLKRLVSSEIHEGAKDEFWKAVSNLENHGITRDVDFIVGSDDEALNTIDENTEVAIFDPPRSGLSTPVVEYLSGIEQGYALKRIIYVSCGFSAFKRDARVLCSTKKWKISAAHFFVLFPGSDHLETLAVFDRIQHTHWRKPKVNVGRRTSNPRNLKKWSPKVVQ